MSDNIKISVVVPIYNVAAYLPKCIESIMRQTYKNLEIILIDDGSTDGCAAICDEYAKKDERIKVCHKKNGGLVSARQAGFEIATGDYIGNVDGDDWIDNGMYESLLNAAVENDAQIVFSDMWRHTFAGDTIYWSGAYLEEGSYDFEKMDRRIVLDYFFNPDSGKKVNGSLANKLFASKLLKNYSFMMNDKIRGCNEDRILVFAMLTACKRIYIRHKAFYHGVDRNGSYSHSVSPLFFEQLQYVYLYLKNVFGESEYSEELYEQMYDFLIHDCIRNINGLAGRTILPDYLINDFSLLSGKNIVLYGAGAVGKSLQKQISASGTCNIVLWVDKKHDISNGVNPVSDIEAANYDFILVAVKDELLFKQIKDELVNKGCDSAAIIWKKPVGLINYFNNTRGGGTTV